MKVTKITAVTAAGLLAALLSGCNTAKEPEIPAVSDENCKTENLAKLEKPVREQLASACFRRGSFKPSTPKSW